MAETDETPEDGEEEAPKKGGKGMLFAIIGAVVMGGGGFFASYSGMLPIGGGGEVEEAAAKQAPKVMLAKTPPSFMPVEGLVISLGSAAQSKHLKFGAQLEVDPEYSEEIEGLRPRILDVVNTYLRAVEERDIESPAAMTRLRAQLLRRVQVVTGSEKVKDLLITEFVLN